MPHLLHPYKLVMGGDIAPVVQSNFALSANDFTTLSSTSTMPTGGSISRAGNAMLYDSTGKLTYAPNNLALYNADFSNGVWSSYYASKVGPYAGTDPAGTNTAYEIGLDGGGGGGSATLVYQTFTAVTGVRYMASFYVRAKTGTTSVRVRFFDGSVNDYSSNITVDSTGWTRVYYAYTSTASSASAFFGINTNSTANTTNVYVAFAQLEAVTYQTSPSGTYYLNYPTPNTTSAYYGPRFDYDPVTLQPKGLLVEGTRTNLVTYGAMAATWSGINCSVAFSQTTTPDGTTSGLRITNTNGNALHRVYSEAFNLTTATTYTASMYVKSGTRTKGCIYIAASNEADVGFGECDFDLVAQTATAANGALSASITSVGNSWYRVTVTGQSNTASCRLFVATNVARTTTYSGDGETLFAYGAQVELGAFATSFTPTVASSVARAAETFSLTGYANRLVEAYYIDEQTGANYSGNSALSTGTVTISPPTFGWVTSLRAYQNAYAGSISTPSWLSFSGTTGTTAGNRTYYDSTGTLTWAPANLIPQSQDFATTWTRGNVSSPTVFISAPDNSNTGAKLAASNTGLVVHQVYNIGVALSAGTYIASVYLKKDAYSYGIVNFYDGIDNYCYFNLDNGVPGTAAAGVTTGMQSVGNGWYRCWARKTISAVTGGMSIEFSNADNTPASSAAIGSGVYAWGAQLERVTYQTAPSAYIPTTSAAVYGPRYDYDPSTAPATPRGLLIEESRTNLFLYSDRLDVSNSLVVSGLSGTFQNGETVTATGGGTGKYLSTGSTSTLILLSAGSGTFTGTLTGGTSGATATISSNTTVWTPRSTASVSANVAVAPDGTTTADRIVQPSNNRTNGIAEENGKALSGRTVSFYAKAGEISAIGTSSGAGENTTINLSTGVITGDAVFTNLTSVYVGNGWWRFSFTYSTATGFNLYIGATSGAGSGNGFFLWGLQVELGSFTTSYIPTTSASVTRAADVAQLTSAAQSSYFNAAAGTFGAQIIRNSSGGNNGVFEVPISAGFNDLIFGDTNTDYRYGSGLNVDTVTGTASTSARVMVGYTASNFTKSLVVNNGTVFTGTAGGAPTYTGGNLKIGYSSTANAYLNGHLQSFAYYNQRLPNAILKQKSSVNAPY